MGVLSSIKYFFDESLKEGNSLPQGAGQKKKQGGAAIVQDKGAHAGRMEEKITKNKKQTSMEKRDEKGSSPLTGDPSMATPKTVSM